MAAIVAVKADPNASSDAATYDIVTLIEELHATCTDLAQAVTSSKPTIVVYIVPGATDVATLAAKLYGKDGLARLDEILTLNRIPNPHAILAGTALRVASPTP